jgi:hypothetical protein
VMTVFTFLLNLEDNRVLFSGIKRDWLRKFQLRLPGHQ